MSHPNIPPPAGPEIGQLAHPTRVNISAPQVYRSISIGTATAQKIVHTSTATADIASPAREPTHGANIVPIQHPGIPPRIADTRTSSSLCYLGATMLSCIATTG